MPDHLYMLKYLLSKGCNLIMSIFRSPFRKQINLKDIAGIPSLVGNGGLALFVNLIENAIEYASESSALSKIIQCGNASTIFSGDDNFTCGNASSSFTGITEFNGGNA